MDPIRKKIRELKKIAYAPYEQIGEPGSADWLRSYFALKKLCELEPEESIYPNTLGYLCFYGRHTGGKRKYEEAREWFEKGAAMQNIESTYKLADMLKDGLGGPADPDRAENLYIGMYLCCKDQFESGMKESKFADVALRMGRMFHEGKIQEKDDMEALGYLLEAKYALGRRKQFDHYGDETVERNINQLIVDCEQPEEEIRYADVYGVGLGRVPFVLRPDEEVRMSVDIGVNDQGLVRLEFRRNRRDGKKPNKVLFPVPPAMQCYMMESVVLYGAGVRRVWNRNPGETVVCDRYKYYKELDLHEFLLDNVLQAKLQGGSYILPVDEFMMMEMEDHPEEGSSICQ